MQFTGLWTFPQLTEALGDDFGVLPWPALDDRGNPSVPVGAYGACVSARSQDVAAAKAFVKWLWIDQTAHQLDFATSYGFHLPARQSLISEAKSLQQGQAAEAAQIVVEHGMAQTPILWTAKDAAAFARMLGTDVAAAAKQRISDDKVVISAIIGDVEERDVIVLDDEIAKGTSVIELLDQGVEGQALSQFGINDLGCRRDEVSYTVQGRRDEQPPFPDHPQEQQRGPGQSGGTGHYVASAVKIQQRSGSNRQWAHGVAILLVTADFPENFPQVGVTTVEATATRKPCDLIELGGAGLTEQNGKGPDRIGAAGAFPGPAIVKLGVRQAVIALAIGE